jgi:hypothetical protein
MKKAILILLPILLFTAYGCVPVEETAETEMEIETVFEEGETVWEKITYSYSDPDTPSFEGNAIMTGWITYKPFYVGEPEAHFHISDESMELLPEEAQYRQDYYLSKFDELEGKNTKIPQEYIEKLEEYSETNPATIRISHISIHMEGSPTMTLVEILE